MSERPGELRQQLRVMAIVPDMEPDPAAICALARGGLRAGATSLQYRNKLDRQPASRLAMCRALRDVCHEFGALFIVNDDPMLALNAGADAVHLGPNDMPVAEARQLVGPGMVIGASAGGLERARAAVADGADYLGVGAIFDATASKPDASRPAGTSLLETMRRDPSLRQVPIVAIGGISVVNAASCIHAGADGVATIRAMFSDGRVSAEASALVAAVMRATG